MKKSFLLLSTMLLFSVAVHAQLTEVKVTVNSGISDAALKHTIEGNTAKLLTMFNQAVVEGQTKLDFGKDYKTICSEDGRKEIADLWKKANAMMCQVSAIDEKVTQLSVGGESKYQMRNIPVLMMNAEGDDENQEIVINYNLQGEIDQIFIAVENHRYQAILDAGQEEEDFIRRQIVLDFVEQFRTAYNRKDMDYISKVFSDDALIITGKVIRTNGKQKDNSSTMLSGDQIVYQTQNKEQYLTNLKKVFKNNKYIDIHFNDIKVQRHPKQTDVYGVNLVQDWTSTTYCDKGYLFLMIDFTNANEPCIQVRTWQPFEYMQSRKDEIFEVEMFNF